MSLQIQKVHLSETIECVVLNLNSRQYKFSDNETTLDKAVIIGIAVHTEALSKSFSGRTVMPNAEMKKGYLTLSTPDTKYPICRLPLETFFNNQNFVLFTEPLLIDIRKSFIDFPNSSALALPGDGLGFSVPISIFYQPFNDQNQKVGEMGTVEDKY